ILRPFNTFGPRQSARAIIPTVIGQIASGQKDLSLGALRPTRDFSYVKDTVRGFIQAALCPNLVGQTVQIGSGHEISIGHLAALIAELMDTKITIHEDPARLRPETSEVERLLADTAKAQRIMEWNPAYAGPQGFRLALQETIAWFRKPDHLKFYKTGEYNL
ncbi:MAG TPA: GDP-mannose 4,6-dehydratase, partial [Alphaproteobacteria bacterium]|nr:GDP-mannose 4,6-dehydratase [Alphaproteobacteria bacterium]